MRAGSLLILGGGSDIGLAVARQFARRGFDIHLAARRTAELEPEASDISIRCGVKVAVHPFDVLAVESHEAFIDDLHQLPDIVVCAVGLLGNQDSDQHDVRRAAVVMRTNFEGPASILGAFADRFEHRGSGTIVGIGSVAGERGRATNYIYGSAKAGFAAFLSGLRNRLASKGVQVLTVLPGFVATKMTRDLNLPRMLTSSPDRVASSIERAIARRRNTIHVGRGWGLVMAIIKAIPEPIFMRMKL